MSNYHNYIWFFIKYYNVKISICIIAFSIEIIVATIRTQYIVHNNIIHKKIYATKCYAKIMDISHYNNHIKIIVKIINNIKLNTPEKARITVRQKFNQLKVGDIIKTSIVFLPPPPNNYPGSYNFRMFSYFSRIEAVGYTISTPILINHNKYNSIINQLREKISNYLYKIMPQETASIATALMVGKKIELIINKRHY